MQDLTHDNLSDDESDQHGYMPGGGSLFVSPVRTTKKPLTAASRLPEENQFWLQMNARSKDNEEKFFGPNSFFDSKTMDDLESLEPEND